MSEYKYQMAYRPYREAVLSGAFKPSDYAIEVDAILNNLHEEGPEANPQYWQWVNSMGWVLNHPLQGKGSLNEYTAWVNSGLGDSFLVVNLRLRL